MIHRQLHGLLTPAHPQAAGQRVLRVSLFHQGHPDMVFYTKEDIRGGRESV